MGVWNRFGENKVLNNWYTTDTQTPVSLMVKNKVTVVTSIPHLVRFEVHLPVDEVLRLIEVLPEGGVFAGDNQHQLHVMSGEKFFNKPGLALMVTGKSSGAIVYMGDSEVSEFEGALTELVEKITK